MTTTEKVQGLASYFPSIEKRNDPFMGHWLQVLGNAVQLKHM